MDLSDEIWVPARRDEVYRALNDPEILQKCVPGCEALTRFSDTEFEARVFLKVGPVKARFKGIAALSPEGAPEHFSLVG